MKKVVCWLLSVWVASVSAEGFDRAKLDAFLNALASHDKAMLSVAIVENGKPIYQHATGFIDSQFSQKADIHTQYRMGSITKMFTSVMIFQLIEEGRLTLDTKLSVFFPKLTNADSINVSMLLNHRSGIHNFTNSPFYQQLSSSPRSQQEVLGFIHQQASDFEPDSQGRYSNSGYVLLGLIIEAITQDSYANQLASRITDKLHLTRTQFGGDIDSKQNQAMSFTFKDNQWSPAPVTELSAVLGAGALVSTPTDIALFLTGLFDGKLVSDASLASMTRIIDRYGRGLFQFPFHDKRAYGHGGRIDGFNAMSGIFVDDDVTFVFVSNGLNYVSNDISIALLSIYFDKPFTPPNFDLAPIELPVPALLAYEGLYSSDSFPLDVTFKVVDGQLTGQATGQEAFELTPYSLFEFRYEPAGITFIFGGSGNDVDYSTLVLKQGGRRIPFNLKQEVKP